MTAFFVRPAVPGDAARIAEIARAAYAEYLPRIGRAPAPMVANFPSEIAAGRVFVLERGGAIDGYLVAWAEADAYFIDNVAVDPTRQGHGLGRALLDHAAAEASRRGLAALRLYTNEAMVENIALYARLGFVETHRATEHEFRRVYMRRELAAAMGEIGRGR